VNDKVVTKSGVVMTASEYNKFLSQKSRSLEKLRMALCNDYYLYCSQGYSDAEARDLIVSRREVSLEKVNNAINAMSRRFNPKMRVELEAKALVLQAREEQALNEELNFLGDLIDRVLDADVNDEFVVESNTGDRGYSAKSLPRDEYLRKLLNDKRKAVRDTLDSLKVFKSDKSNVNVVITENEQMDRLRSGLEKFGVGVTVEDSRESTD